MIGLFVNDSNRIKVDYNKYYIGANGTREQDIKNTIELLNNIFKNFKIPYKFSFDNMLHNIQVNKTK